MLMIRGKIGEATARLLGRYLAVSAALVVAGLLLKLRASPQDNYGFVAFAVSMDLACLWALVRAKVVTISIGKKPTA